MGYDLSVRKLDQPIFDGTTGNKVADAVEYQLGATVNGEFVPFVSRTGEYVDAVVSKGKAAREAGTQNDEAPADPTAAAAPVADTGNSGAQTADATEPTG